MLAYILAIAIALGSLFFYMAAFFFPEVHRKNDFYWAFLGLFYALVLWVAANRITGSVLLAQTASVVLLFWMGQQTLTLRKSVTPAAMQTEVPPEIAPKARTSPLSSFIGLFRKQKATPTETAAKSDTVEETVENVEESATTSIEEAVKEIEESSAIAAKPEVDIISDETVEEETETETVPESEPIEETETESPSPEAATPEIVVENVGSEDDTLIEKFTPKTETTPTEETASEDNPVGDDLKPE